jgi:hypothetical protein
MYDRKEGIATAARIAMTATAIISSINVNARIPRFREILATTASRSMPADPLGTTIVPFPPDLDKIRLETGGLAARLVPAALPWENVWNPCGSCRLRGWVIP